MAPSDDPLDDPGEGMPASPARRRAAIAAGILMLLLILVTLVWFIAENADAPDDRGGGILGSRATPDAARPIA